MSVNFNNYMVSYRHRENKHIKIRNFIHILLYYISTLITIPKIFSKICKYTMSVYYESKQKKTILKRNLRTSGIMNLTYTEEYTFIISHSFYKYYINFQTQIKKIDTIYYSIIYNASARISLLVKPVLFPVQKGLLPNCLKNLIYCKIRH